MKIWVNLTGHIKIEIVNQRDCRLGDLKGLMGPIWICSHRYRIWGCRFKITMTQNYQEMPPKIVQFSQGLVGQLPI